MNSNFSSRFIPFKAPSPATISPQKPLLHNLPPYTIILVLIKHKAHDYSVHLNLAKYINITVMAFPLFEHRNVHGWGSSPSVVVLLHCLRCIKEALSFVPLTHPHYFLISSFSWIGPFPVVPRPPASGGEPQCCLSRTTLPPRKDFRQARWTSVALPDNVFLFLASLPCRCHISHFTS